MSVKFDHHTVELDWGGQPLTLETGKVARQADGAVLATLGETVVLATVVSAKQPKSGIDFFPLTVNYQEKYFAAGKIPGGYFKREGRPTEAETLTSRLIDRPIRPLFPAGYKNETQVIITVLQHDLENEPDVLAMVAASAALTISGVPFMGPIGAARVGYIDGEYVLNTADRPSRRFQARPHHGRHRRCRADGGIGSQGAFRGVMLGAVMFGHQQSQKVIDAIIKLAELAAKDPRDFTAEDRSRLEGEMLALVEDDLRAAYKNTDKQARYAAVDAVKAKVKAHFMPEEGEAKYTPEQVGACSSRFRPRSCAGTFSTPRPVSTDVISTTVRPIVVRSRRSAPHPRFGALYPRRNPGAGRCDPGHGR